MNNNDACLNLTYEQRQAIATVEQLTTIFAQLSLRNAAEIQLVIDLLTRHARDMETELEKEALQHLFGFLIAMREEALLP